VTQSFSVQINDSGLIRINKMSFWAKVVFTIYY